MRWSRKQAECLFLGATEEPHFLAWGATGTGKTEASIFGFCLWMCNFNDKIFGLVAKTKDQVRDNVHPAIRRFIETTGVHGVITSRGIVTHLGSNRLISLSGNDISSAKSAQGFNFAGIYIDEVVNIDKTVMMELSNRARTIDAPKIVMTGNPTHLTHHFYVDYVKRADEIGMKVVAFQQSDAHFMSDRVKETIQKTSVGGWYERRVLGIPANLSGLIYPAYEKPSESPDWSLCESWYLAVDVGYSSATHALLIGKFRDVWWVCGELRLEFRRSGNQMTEAMQAQAIRAWIDRLDLVLRGIIVDAAAKGMIGAMQNEFGVRTVGGRKDTIYDPDSESLSIQFTRIMLSQGQVRLSNKVQHLYDELLLYTYDESKEGDVPIKSGEIHGLDALRYFLFTMGKAKTNAKTNSVHELRNLSTYRSLAAAGGYYSQ